MKNDTELRKYPRVPSQFPVIFKLGQSTSRTQAVNLGGGGLRLGTSSLPSGAELTMRFRTSKHYGFIQAKARVVYAQPNLGSGVEFTDINQDQRQLILKIIHGSVGNRRKVPRVPLATQIYIDDSMGLAHSRDLSQGGIFIETKLPGKIGAQIDLRFHLTEDDPVIIAKGVIRYLVPRLGMGVQFTELSGNDEKRIAEYVASSAEVLAEPN